MKDLKEERSANFSNKAHTLPRGEIQATIKDTTESLKVKEVKIITNNSLITKIGTKKRNLHR